MAQSNQFDVWILSSQTVYKQVPYNVVTDWVAQGRLLPDDRLKLSGTEPWVRIGDTAAFATFLPRADDTKVGDVAEALERVEIDVKPRKGHGDEDDDVDMIPLIDISLVLLVFFMMTSTVTAIAHSINLPKSENAFTPDSTGNTWIGIDLVGVEKKPVYSIGENEKAPLDGEGLMTRGQLLAAVDRRLATDRKQLSIRIAGHSDTSLELINELLDDLNDRKDTGCKIFAVRAETTKK